MIETVIFFILIFIGLIFMHETGHAFVAEYYKLHPKFKLNKKGVYVETDKATKIQKKNIAAGGVFFGFFILMELPFIIGWYALLFVIVYLWGVKDDLKQIL